MSAKRVYIYMYMYVNRTLSLGGLVLCQPMKYKYYTEVVCPPTRYENTYSSQSLSGIVSVYEAKIQRWCVCQKSMKTHTEQGLWVVLCLPMKYKYRTEVVYLLIYKV